MDRRKNIPAGYNMDKTDLTLIYKQNKAGLIGFISRRVESEEERKDILQNVFYSLAKIDLVRNPIEHVTSWLYSVARNQIIDRRRKKKEERMPRRSYDPDEDGFLSDVSEFLSDNGDYDPETVLLKSLVWEELECALAELPPEQRAVFELTEMEGIPFKEIAKSTGIPVNTLLSRKRYAVLHLRQRLKALYDEFREK